jgi:hypothetical protein
MEGFGLRILNLIDFAVNPKFKIQNSKLFHKEAGHAFIHPAEDDSSVSRCQALRRRLSPGTAEGHHSPRCGAVSLLPEYLAGVAGVAEIFIGFCIIEKAAFP